VLSPRESRKSSFVSRIMMVLIVTLGAIFAGLTLLGVPEFEKLFEPSWTRSLTILTSSIFSILLTNYVSANTGRNFIDWKTELLISFNFILLYSAILLPGLFPLSIEVEQPWYKPFFGSTNSIRNYWFYGLFILQAPMLIVTFRKVRAYLFDEENRN
jgi:hypothetical protein